MYGYTKIETEFFKMNEVAKIINMKNFGKNNIFKLLRDEGILNNNNYPHEDYTNLGYFKQILTQVNFYKNHLIHSASCMASKTGIDFIKTLIAKQD